MCRLLFGSALLCALSASTFFVNCNESRVVNGFDLNDYHSFNEIVRYVNSVQNDRLSVEILGFSSEQLPIPIVKINRNATKSILIDAGTHAREWISIAGAIQLLTNLSRSNDWPAVNVYIIPVVNPDGYEHSRTKDRMWRNSRSGLLKCGVDLNRNYANNWARVGTSNKLCSEIYHGRGPFSEPESRAVGSFMRQHLNELRGYISLHAYENAILVPFGYSFQLIFYAKPPNYNELFSTAKQITQSMNGLYGNNYTVIKSSSLYPASGCSDDYAKSLGIRYVYTIELTTGFYEKRYVGFETPKQLIAPNGDELRAGIVRLLQIIESQP